MKSNENDQEMDHEPLIPASASTAFDFWRSQMVFEEESQFLNDGTPRGLIGLYNQGNSCYMNAAIQALSNCPPLREYFRSYLPSITQNRTINGFPSQKNQVSDSFRDLLLKIWSTNPKTSAIGPSLFNYKIKDRCAQFRGFTQQDAQEFIRCFLDILHQELRQTTQPNIGDDGKATTESLSSSCSSSQEALDSAGNDHPENGDSGLSSDTGEEKPKRVTTPSKLQTTPEKKRTTSESAMKKEKERVLHLKSIITDVFDGELVSTVKCMTCHHLSNTTETFQDISLSIPTVEQINYIRETSTNTELESSSSFSGEQTPKSSSSLTSITEEETHNSTNSLTEKTVQHSQFSYATWLLFFVKSWLIDSWLNYFLNWYRFMFSTNISLEDCLYAFFSADHLHGEDMYSCEKCSKLRNGVKQCRLTKLPEILCIHLKRFRHEVLYNSKVTARITFPLYDLNMKPFILQSVLEQTDSEEYSTEYDLVAFVSHRGAGAEFGHYVAYCRNEIDGNWYEFDDAFVSPIADADVMNREAYVLFYQKKGTPSTEMFKEQIGHVLNSLKEPPINSYFISSEWLYRFRTFSDPGPITNTDFLCEHLELKPLANQNQVVALPANIWNMLYQRYGGGPPCDRMKRCMICSKKVIEILKRKDEERQQFLHLANSQRYMAHLADNIVSYSWYEQWEQFVMQFDRNPPGPIRNEALVQKQKDGSQKLRNGVNYKSLTRDQWTYLHSIYGGGPELYKTYDRQPTTEEVEEIIRHCDMLREQQKMKIMSEPIVEHPDSDSEETKSKRIKITEITETTDSDPVTDEKCENIEEMPMEMETAAH